MPDLHTKVTVQCFRTHDVINFVMDILGSAVTTKKATILESRGMLKLTRPVSVVVTVTVQKKALGR